MGRHLPYGISQSYLPIAASYYKDCSISLRCITIQGAALYAYNDAVFSEDDWKGIRMLLQSVKQNDPHKVGYFGMGFKSVFHITGRSERRPI